MPVSHWVSRLAHRHDRSCRVTAVFAAADNEARTVDPFWIANHLGRFCGASEVELRADFHTGGLHVSFITPDDPGLAVGRVAALLESSCGWTLVGAPAFRLSRNVARVEPNVC